MTVLKFFLTLVVCQEGKLETATVIPGLRKTKETKDRLDTKKRKIRGA